MSDTAPTYGGENTASKSQESRLLDLINRTRNNTAGSYAVHLRLSELPASHRQPHFIRMVGRSLDSLASQQDVQVFNFLNVDVVLMCRNTPIDEVDDAVFRVRALFNEDSITHAEDGSAEDRFSAWYDLSQPTDFKDFEDSIKTIAQSVHEVKSQIRDAAPTGRASKLMKGEPLAPDQLQAIGQKLLEVRIGDLVHRQPAVRVSQAKKQELAFREHYIAMSELQIRIAPKTNIFSSHWLFQYLSETIDARLLEVLARLEYATMDYPVSINLNLSTVLSRPFQNFDAIVGEHANMVIIEIQVIDIFADMRSYEEVRDWLQARGYRVLIDGLSPLTLDFFDPSSLNADFAKISWGPEVKGGLGQEQTKQIASNIRKLKPGKVVLARVDSEEGVSWGLSLGILCYQGHFIDKVVEAMAQKGAIK